MTSIRTERKRLKSKQACDYCRQHKLRCLYPSDLDMDINSGPVICEHCSKFEIGCVFQDRSSRSRRLRNRLPIHCTVAADLVPLSDRTSRSTRSRSPVTTDRREMTLGGNDPFEVQSQANGSAQPFQDTGSAFNRISEPGRRILGPTSLSYFLDGLTDAPEDVLGHDRAYGLSRPGGDHLYSQVHLSPSLRDPLVDRHIAHDMITHLMHTFVQDVGPLLGIIPAERSHANDPSRPVVLAMCAAAALSRRVSWDIFRSLRASLLACLDSSVTRISSLENVQTLAIISMSAEIHGISTGESGSSAWLTSATAIRQAQDLGLHRKLTRASESHLASCEARMWMACVVMDRWYAHTYGQPPMIDLAYCDDLLGDNVVDHRTGFAFQNYMYRLATLLSSISYAIYRPCGLAQTDDRMLNELLSRLDQISSGISDSFEFHGVNSSVEAGLLNMIICCIEVALFRNFVMQPSAPPRQDFHVRPARWYAVCQRAHSVIDWVAASGDLLMDTWFIAMYCLAHAALVEHFTVIKENDHDALAKLNKALLTFARWSEGNGDGVSAIRAKVTDIIRLLYDSADRHLRPAGLISGETGPITQQEPDRGALDLWTTIEDMMQEPGAIDWMQFLGTDLTSMLADSVHAGHL